MQGRSVAKRGRYCTTGRCDDVGADLARAVVQVAAAGDVSTAPCDSDWVTEERLCSCTPRRISKSDLEFERERWRKVKAPFGCAV